MPSTPTPSSVPLRHPGLIMNSLETVRKPEACPRAAETVCFNLRSGKEGRAFLVKMSHSQPLQGQHSRQTHHGGEMKTLLLPSDPTISGVRGRELN